MYNLSVLSSVSPRHSDHLPPSADALLRLPALFSIGVHDISDLERREKDASLPMGWAACTTDEIITTKPQLYDMVVELPAAPPPHQPQGQPRSWPRIRTSHGSVVKASQRDVARYRLLHRELFRLRNPSEPSPGAYTDAVVDNDDDDNNDTAPLLSRDEVDTKRADEDFDEAYDDSMVEPSTWSRLAYSGFMWWASAGERDAYTAAEHDTDRDLLGDLAEASQPVETAIIAYFHRQSSLLIDSLAQRIQDEREESSNADDDDDDGETLSIHRDELSQMGLDTWSEADRAFVQEFVSLYFGRTVVIKGTEVDCCGLRVPLL